ncbi:hypothetical protein FACS1894184_18900 [Clostridia bacterium]|nr:hypothetical protein FACS1894184_18900 [Clostridia bacterium]
MFDYYPTISEAAKYSDIPIPKWLKWIKQGLIPANPDLSEDKLTECVEVVRIPLRSLPRHAADRYLKTMLLKDQFFSVDLISILHERGDSALLLLFEDIRVLKEVSLLRMSSDGCFSQRLAIYASNHGISVPTIYRKEELLMKSDLRKLVSPQTGIHSKKLCSLAMDYLIYHHLRPNHPSQNILLESLNKEAESLGKLACKRCAYNSSCLFDKSGMVCTAGRWTVNRLLSSISDQQAAFSRSGRNFWEAHYAHKTKRDKPESVNTVWFGDHHLADVIVIVGSDANKQPICARPWLTVVTDAASDAIVGSIVTLRPNSQTIAECFCRAAAFTIDSPFYGLPEVFYVDRGRDYRSKIIEGVSPS